MNRSFSFGDGTRLIAINADMISHIYFNQDMSIVVHIGATVLNIPNGKDFLRLLKEVCPAAKWIVDEPGQPTIIPRKSS